MKIYLSVLFAFFLSYVAMGQNVEIFESMAGGGKGYQGAITLRNCGTDATSRYDQDNKRSGDRWDGTFQINCF